MQLMHIEKYHEILTHLNPTRGDLNRVSVVTGVSGCGKDYLLGHALKHGDLPRGIAVFSFGEELFQVLRSKYPLLKSRDDIKSMLTSDQLMGGICHTIDTVLDQQPAILNTHVAYKQGINISTNPRVESRINAKNYVFVWAEPEQIVEWRLQDTSRQRESESVEDVAIHQALALAMIITMAKYLGSGVHTIHNECSSVSTSLSDLNQYISEGVS